MKWLRWLGISIQAFILGIFLALAIGKLIALEIGARVFRYQGF